MRIVRVKQLFEFWGSTFIIILIGIWTSLISSTANSPLGKSASVAFQLRESFAYGMTSFRFATMNLNQFGKSKSLLQERLAVADRQTSTDWVVEIEEGILMEM